MYFQKPLQRPQILRVQIPVLGVLVVAVGKRETSSRHKSSIFKCSIPLKLLISKFLNPSIIGYLMFNPQIYTIPSNQPQFGLFFLPITFSPAAPQSQSPSCQRRTISCPSPSARRRYDILCRQCRVKTVCVQFFGKA